ncbi:hypothetical protein GHYDROH2_00830 [Geobacter hydrogenophilus]|uniref:Uncharacterized protein n=1 Tax=Geobacter hydrogenophilus TaxID=40983 RepID=A0A9W6L9M0_9BACT|nr:hypothetical protein GHYDROH2_00830 [Geobacter hydrogenophilus]
MDTKVNAICWGSIHGKKRRAYLRGPQRMVKCQGVPNGTPLAVGRNNNHITDVPQCLCKRPYPRSPNSVVIRNKNFHSFLKMFTRKADKKIDGFGVRNRLR